MASGPLDMLVAQRKKQHRNCIIIIADRSSETGKGKSTLALVLARRYDPNFSVENVLFDTNEFIKHVSQKRRPGAWYVLDEIGVYLDTRRSMSRGNVSFTQLLQIFREEQMSLIATLPTTSVLDQRMKELADVVILTHDRGSATAYRIGTNPFSIKRPIYMNEFEQIRWSSLDGSELWAEYKAKKRAFLDKKYDTLLGAKRKKKEKKVTKKEKILELLAKGINRKKIAEEVGTKLGYVNTVAWMSKPSK
ncbi:MAG: hypothetical protein JRC90_10120 [Deltaproteobacteria bacterium]|nr:hypothetical protein [Deltaproteobacteria bacterium]